MNTDLQRGAIVIIADRRSEFAGKPRPAIVLQRGGLAALSTVTVCPLTTEERAAPLLRIPVPATPTTGLKEPSWAMIDRITTVRRTRCSEPVGHLDDTAMRAIDRALLVFIGVADAARGVSAAGLRHQLRGRRRSALPRRRETQRAAIAALQQRVTALENPPPLVIDGGTY